MNRQRPFLDDSVLSLNTNQPFSNRSSSIWSKECDSSLNKYDLNLGRSRPVHSSVPTPTTTQTPANLFYPTNNITFSSMTTTPKFLPSSAPQVSSYLDINTSINKPTETPLTTPVLGSYMHSRFFPSPKSERIRYQNYTTNNTPYSSKTVFGGMDQMPQLNLGSDHRNPDFFTAPGLKRSTTSDATPSFQPASSILDILENKSEDSFEIFRKNEDYLPNFVYDELSDDNDPSFLGDDKLFKSTRSEGNGFLYDNQLNIGINTSATTNTTTISSVSSSPVLERPKSSTFKSDFGFGNYSFQASQFTLNGLPKTDSSATLYLPELDMGSSLKQETERVIEKVVERARDDKKSKRKESKGSKESKTKKEEKDIEVQSVDKNTKTNKPTRTKSKSGNRLTVVSTELEQTINKQLLEEEEMLRRNIGSDDEVQVSLLGFFFGNPKDKVNVSILPVDSMNSSVSSNSLKSLPALDTEYPEGFASTFYKRAENNFMFVREIQSKSTIIKNRKGPSIEFRISLPTLRSNKAKIIPQSIRIPTESDTKPKQRSEYKSYTVKIDLSELEGKIGGLRVSKSASLSVQSSKFKKKKKKHVKGKV